ncbi:hypothetical protein [Mycolicibacterium frederiksbergense]|uniref:hypothetical protein n=1 Tax=Mycolicibacterium frederiksbergense TaxID=117567 RepID=UPI003999D1F3
MDAQGLVRVRTSTMVALTGAAVIATATAVSAPPVQRAAENVVPAVVHEVKSLPVQLTAYNPFVPYAQPVGVVGYALTTVFATQTALLLPTFDGATQALTEAGLDPRWAQQPQLIARSLLLPVAVAVQTALVGGLEGTYVYGKFTPAEALSFFVDAVKTALEGFVAAEKALFGQSTLAPKVSGATAATPEVSSTELPDAASTVTLSTGQTDSAPATGLTHATAGTTTNDDDQAKAGGAEITGEAAVLEAPETTDVVTSVPKKPTFTFPTLKLPKLKLPTLKFPTPKKTTRPATTTSGTSAANVQADNDSVASSPKSGESDSSDRSGDSGSTAN